MKYAIRSQPPSGGCVLKLCFLLSLLPIQQNQPPSGGCVLKLVNFFDCRPLRSQPPSGGCVLKQRMAVKSSQNVGPAAFGRLCVETHISKHCGARISQPPSGGCVLKQRFAPKLYQFLIQPPSGGCVLKQEVVEVQAVAHQPPSGGCVLKRLPPKAEFY